VARDCLRSLGVTLALAGPKLVIVNAGLKSPETSRLAHHNVCLNLIDFTLYIFRLTNEPNIAWRIAIILLLSP
jgi:hypothetical protein